MAIIIKKTTEQSNVLPLYTNSLQKTKLFVGLGNPGEKYKNNRHNIGFMCLDYFAINYELKWQYKNDLECFLTQTTLFETKVILCKPQTFINLSGRSIQKVLSFYKINLEDMFILHDEIRLNSGILELIKSTDHYGHNGLKSIHDLISDSLNLIRIGIGPKTPSKISLSNFVLSNFAKTDQDNLKIIAKETSSIIGEISSGNFNPEKRKVFI